MLGAVPTIRTISQALRHEPAKTKGSRFIASVLPISSPEEARIYIAARCEEFRDATHNCFAWRAGAGGDSMRYSDDGEPSGTAGRPILQEIDGRRLTDVLVVVTRYFGGTKLGTGGLIRAYGGAASEALDLATVVEVPIVEVLSVSYPYELTGVVEGVFHAYGVSSRKTEYVDGVCKHVAVPVEEVTAFEQALKDVTAGRVKVRRSESRELGAR